ncbi:hypothetical protein FKP32DRAFT_1679480 [Trametes sanguinea]|nr:hypothetical protein FKP32DRAFT_1679480 [Trametes sanguinea]
MPASPSSSKFRAPPSPASVTSSSDLAPHHHSLRQDAKHVASQLKRRVSRLFHSKHHHHTHSNAGSGVVKFLADGIYHTLSDPIFSPHHSHGVVTASDSTPTKADIPLPESPSGYSDSGESTISSVSSDLPQTASDSDGTDSKPLQYPHALSEDPKAYLTQDGALDTVPALPEIVITTDESPIERPALPTSSGRAAPPAGDDMKQEFVRRGRLSLASIESLTAPLETLVLMDGEVQLSPTLLESLESLPATLDTLASLVESEMFASEDLQRVPHVPDVAAHAPLTSLAADSPVLPSLDLQPLVEPGTPRISPAVPGGSALLLKTDNGSESVPVTPHHVFDPPTPTGTPDMRAASDNDTTASDSAATEFPPPSSLASPCSSPESTPRTRRRASSPFTPRMPGLYRWPTPGPTASVGDIDTDDNDAVHSVYLPALDLLRMFVPIPNIRFRFILKFLLMWWLF